MKHMICGLTLLLMLAAGDRAAAQARDTVPPVDVTAQVEGVMERSGIGAALDSLAAVSAPELEHAFEQLSTTLATLALRIAGDRELRMSAARAAHGMAEVAETVILEQSTILQDILRAAAERLEKMSVPADTAADRHR